MYLFLDTGCVLFTQSCLTLCNPMDAYFIVILYNLQMFTILVYLLSILSLKTKQKIERRNFWWKKKGKWFYEPATWIKVRTLKWENWEGREKWETSRERGELAGEEPHWVSTNHLKMSFVFLALNWVVELNCNIIC